MVVVVPVDGRYIVVPSASRSGSKGEVCAAAVAIDDILGKVPQVVIFLRGVGS